MQKGLDVTVFDAIKSDVEGKFESGAYTGTLENGGVSLSSFGEFEKDLPEGLTGELDQLKQDIIDGKIEINSPASPKPAQ